MSHSPNRFHINTLHQALSIDDGVEEPADIRLELLNRFNRSEINDLRPTSQGDASFQAVNGGDKAIAPNRLSGFGGKPDIDATAIEERRPEDHFSRTIVEQSLCALDCPNAAADAAGEGGARARDQRSVRAEAPGCIEVDDLNERELAEALKPLVKVVEGECEALPLDELHDLPAL
jgi:hypothetical protein